MLTVAGVIQEASSRRPDDEYRSASARIVEKSLHKTVACMPIGRRRYNIILAFKKR
jgi:hypothetical protein